jgi:hypothetical protein
MIRLKADAFLRIFHDGKLARSGLGFLDVAVSDAPRIMRVCACWSTYGVAAEISWTEISRVRSEIRAGALFVRATGEVTQLSDRVLDRGEVMARLVEELSRDEVHLEVSRRGVLLTEIKIARAALDGLIVLLAELDVASAVCHASAQNAPVLLPQ